MPTAIVTGATGILGRQIVSALGKDPSTWTTVHALSRSQKEQYPPNVTHDSIDLTGDCKQMADQLKSVEGEVVFFAAYLQKDDPQEEWDANGAMLTNFLDALDDTGASKKLKRVILVTGAKQYGLHLGRTKNPMQESDPRIDSAGRPPNFYYHLQDILKARSSKGNWDWVVTYPNDVIGFARNNFMNLASSLGLYAAVSAELDSTLPWPGSEYFYSAATTFTSSKLHADFCIWAASTPDCGNQAFNVVNGDVETWENLWPRLAARFGAKVPENQFHRKSPPGLSSRTQLAERPPIADYHAAVAGLEGSRALAPSHLEARIDVTKWSQLDEVKEAWEKLAAREGLDKAAFEKATWGFLMFELGRDFDVIISMSKAREFGYTGYRDTWSAFEEVFAELEEAGVLPKRRS